LVLLYHEVVTIKTVTVETVPNFGLIPCII
jgi:hypothetical protein